MKQAPDRKRLRREYLRKKSQAYTMAGGAGLMLVPTTIACALLLVSALCILLLYAMDHRNPSDDPGLIIFMTVLTALGVCSGLMARAAWIRVERARQTLARLPYVPPVTPDSLPADEILVRGSEEPPVVQSEILLRAVKHEETPKEELLRVSREG